MPCITGCHLKSSGLLPMQPHLRTQGASIRAAPAMYGSHAAWELAAAESLMSGPATGGEPAAGALHVEMVSFMCVKAGRRFWHQ